MKRNFAAIGGALALALVSVLAQAQTFQGRPPAGTVQNGQAGALAIWTATPTLGIGGTTLGTLTFSGNTSGTTVLRPAAAASGTLTLPAATDTLVGRTTTDTLTNKTLTSPIINGGTIDSAGISQSSLTGTSMTMVIVDNNLQVVDDGDTSKRLKFQVSGVTTATTRTLTIPDANTTIVGTDATQTLTNKTLTAPTISGGSHTALTSLGVRSTGSGAFDLTLNNTENLTAGRTLTLTVNDAARTISLAGNLTTAAAFTTAGANALTLTTTGSTNVTLPTTGTLATRAGVEALTNKTLDNTNAVTLKDSSFTLQDDGDATKQLTLQLSGITTGTTRTWTVPDATSTFVGTDTTQTLTNKALTSPTINTATINTPTITGGTHTAITSLGVRSTGTGAFDLKFANNENITADRTITFTTNNLSRNIALGGDVSTAGTIVFAGNFSTSAAVTFNTGVNATTFNTTGVTSVTLPTTGTLATLAGSETLTNKTFNTANNTFQLNGTTVTTASSILDTISGASTQGSILYRDGGSWAALSPSTAGRVLSTNGAGLNPSWIAVGGTGTVTSVATADCLTGGPIATSGTVSLACPIVPQGRLTVISNTPVPTLSVNGSTTGATVIYYTAYNGRLVPVRDPTASALRQASICAVDTVGACEISITLGSNWAANSAYDVYITNDAGTIKLCTIAWTNVTTRATVLLGYNGILTNNGSTTCRTSNTSTITMAQTFGTYVGSFYTNGSTGQVDYSFGGTDTTASLGVCNYYNRVNTQAQVTDGGASYTYTSNTVRQKRGTTTYQIKFMNCLQEDATHVIITESINTVAAANARALWGVGLDSTTTYVPGARSVCNTNAAAIQQCIQPASGFLMAGIGVHTISANESSDNVNANTYNAVIAAALTAVIRN